MSSTGGTGSSAVVVSPATGEVSVPASATGVCAAGSAAASTVPEWASIVWAKTGSTGVSSGRSVGASNEVSAFVSTWVAGCGS